MLLTVAERKQRMPHGAQGEIARSGVCDGAYVSRTMSGEVFPKTKRAQQKLRRVQRACARKIGLPLEHVFSREELDRAGWPVLLKQAS